MSKWKIFVVPHTHWDKEWYFTKQDSDILLAQNIKNMKEVFKNNSEYKSFTYDGQTSIVDDYLDYYKDDQEFFQLINNKKLLIGPWYTQPDFFNTTSESIVRNLLYGIKLAQEYGGEPLKTAYVPDSFGHNAQMPQIYQQFGLKNFIYWRGVRKTEIDRFGTLTHWKGIDGTIINAYNFLFGYWVMGSLFPYLDLNQSNIQEKAQVFLEKFAPLLNELKANTHHTQNKILIPLGGDQAPINQFTPEFFQTINRWSDDEWILSDYDTFFEELEINQNLGILENELKSPALARIHKTIGSQRVDIKKLMKKAETNLYDLLEPLAVYWTSMGGKYPQQSIDQALKWILISQAHDSAGGCNSDEVNEDIANRLRKANDLILSEITRIQKQVAQVLCLKENDILIFNPKPYSLTKAIKVKLFTKEKDFTIQCLNERLDFTSDTSFQRIDSLYHHGGSLVNGISKTQGETSIISAGFYESNVLLTNAQLKPMSFSIFRIQEKTKKVESKEVFQKLGYEICVNDDGTINLVDQTDGQKYHNQFKIYANEDAGDSYDYSPLNSINPEISQIIKSEHQITHSSPELLKLQITNTYFVASKNQNQIFLLDLEITPQSVINLQVQTKNLMNDIRWRIVFDTQLKTNYSVANQAYHTIERPVELTQDLKIWEKEKWTEKPVGIETMESFVYLKNKDLKIGFITNGNNEYEILKNQEIHLTLYRSVSFLGRNNLLWRPGRASGTSELLVETKAAAFINQELNFEFFWFKVNNPEINIWKLAQDTILKIPYYQVQNLNKLEKRFDRFLFQNETGIKNVFQTLFTIKNPNFIVKTIKQSWDQEGFIVRGFNSGNKDLDFNLMFNNQEKIFFQPVNLLEENKVNQKIIKNVQLKPMEIGTYFISKNNWKIKN